MKIRTLFITFFACLLCFGMAFANTCQLQQGAGGKQFMRCTLSKKDTVTLNKLFSRTNAHSSRIILTPRQVSEIKKLLPTKKTSNAIVLHITKNEAKAGYWIRPVATFVK